MSTANRPADATAAALESARFVRVIARADGDALAAAGVLARALDERETPFHVSVASTVAERTARARGGADDDRERTIVVGPSDAEVPQVESSERPATLSACDLAGDLGATPDPVLALAGAAAAGVEPGAGETEWLLEAATDRDLATRRDGVAVPTADLVDGLAHATGCRAPWSGDPEATREALESIGAAGDDPDADVDHRAVASLAALDAVGCPDATVEAATAIGRFLRPYETPAAPFETVGGYAEVLEATARSAPGVAVALALGHDARDRALEAWREHGRRAHEALDAADAARHDGLFVLEVGDGPVETVARIAAAFRSPEPLVLAVGDGEAGLAASDDRTLEAPLEALARDLEAEYDAGRRGGYLRFDPALEAETVVAEVRESL